MDCLSLPSALKSALQLPVATEVISSGQGREMTFMSFPTSGRRS